MIKNRRQPLPRQSGFILTIEAVLIMTILGIGLFVGLIAVRDALFKQTLSQQGQDFYVFDSSVSPVILGKVAAFDVHETPIVTFVDYGARVDGSGNELNFRALIGVRDDRFTSRQPIFYSNASCTTDPCIAGPSVELYNIGIDGVVETGSVGYLNALQDITYAIGAGDPAVNSGVKGRLLRQTSTACTVTATHAWISQRVVAGSPCTDIADIDLNVTGFWQAESVDYPAGTNVLDSLTPPFYTNMVGKPSLDDYSTVAPTVGGG